MEIDDKLKKAATDYYNSYFHKLTARTWDECKNTTRVKSFLAGANWRESQNTSTSDEALHIGNVVKWLPFKREFSDKYKELAKSGKLIKLYDDGTQIRHGEDEPIACVTHFREG